MEEFQTINRAVVMVIPKKPFDDWARELYQEEYDSLLEHRTEYNSYLVSDEILTEDPKKALKKHWKFIFQQELFDMYRDDRQWPKRLTWNLFCEFFDVKFSTVVLDLLSKRLIKEDF
ncbi:hypothetical protein [Pontibacter sp. G13]|uniref:hypothetical protein n=1 Tax=Pontibacter sp. G13 TaxID=3074898 RepID=UPI0028895D3C|nr:hypothetical protein [Pontibacter sp. G13]WNJ17571.1 hypothetical protein RJD25_22200 [Pontibacter sp. G13]